MSGFSHLFLSHTNKRCSRQEIWTMCKVIAIIIIITLVIIVIMELLRVHLINLYLFESYFSVHCAEFFMRYTEAHFIISRSLGERYLSFSHFPFSLSPSPLFLPFPLFLFFNLSLFLLRQFHWFLATFLNTRNNSDKGWMNHFHLLSHSCKQFSVDV